MNLQFLMISVNDSGSGLVRSKNTFDSICKSERKEIAFDIRFKHSDYFANRIVIQTKIEYRVQSENKNKTSKKN